MSRKVEYIEPSAKREKLKICGGAQKKQRSISVEGSTGRRCGMTWEVVGALGKLERR